MTASLTTLMKELLDSGLLRVEDQGSHVIVVLSTMPILDIITTARTEVVTSLIPKTQVTLGYH